MPFQGFLPTNAYLLVKPLGVASHMNRNFPHSRDATNAQMYHRLPCLAGPRDTALRLVVGHSGKGSPLTSSVKHSLARAQEDRCVCAQGL